MARFLYTVLLNPSLDEAKLDCRSGYVYPDSENVFECQTMWKDSISLSCVEACGEACVECGACSEEKFVESDEYKTFIKNNEIGIEDVGEAIVVLVIFLLFFSPGVFVGCFYFICCKG